MENDDIKDHLLKLHNAGYYDQVLRYFENQKVCCEEITKAQRKEYLKNLAVLAPPDHQTEISEALAKEELVLLTAKFMNKATTFIVSPLSCSEILIKNFSYEKKMLELNNEKLDRAKFIKLKEIIFIISSNR